MIYHILNTPCFVYWMLAEAINTDSPSTFLVSSGNITPSSHKRDVEK